MQINHSLLTNASLVSNTLLTELKDGDMVRAQIKERISSNEAVITINGKDRLAQFTNGVPSENRFSVEVQSQTETAIQVKAVAQDRPSSIQSTTINQTQLNDLAITAKDTPELKQAVNMMIQKNVPLTKETVESLRTFITKTEAPMETKLETIKALANKSLEPTTVQLKAVHEALHGKPINEVLSNLAKELDPNFKIDPKPTMVTTTSSVKESTPITPTTTVKLVDTPQSQWMNQVRVALEKEPNITKALEQVKTAVTNHPSLSKEVYSSILKVVNEAEKLQSIGKDRVVSALKLAEVALSKVEQPTSNLVKEAAPLPANLQDKVAQITNQVSISPAVSKSVENIRTNLLTDNRLSNELKVQLEQSLKEAQGLTNQGRITAGRQVLASAMTQLSKEVENQSTNGTVQSQPLSNQVQVLARSVALEPNIDNQINQVRQDVVQNSAMNKEVGARVEQALKEAATLNSIGQEAAGKQRIQQALAQASTDLKVAEARAAQPGVTQGNVSTNGGQAENVQPNTQQPPVSQQPGTQSPTIQDSSNTESNKQQSPSTPSTSIQQSPTMNQTGTGSLQDSSTTVVDQEKQEAMQAVQQIKAEVEQETDPQKAIQKIAEQLLNNKALSPIIAKEIERLVQQADQLTQAGKDRVLKMLEKLEASLKQAVTMPTTPGTVTNEEAPNLQTPSNQLVSSSIQQAILQLQQTANLEEAITAIRQELSSNPKIDIQTLQKMETVLDEASNLANKGREMKARQLVNQELEQFQKQIGTTESKNQATLDDLDVNQYVQSLGLNTKDIIVTKVTKQLAEATQAFKELKRDISKSLDNTHRLLDQYKGGATVQAKQMLESAISKLDNTILKSDLMLLTDMKTEKSLMQASSKLAEARNLLSKGEVAQASTLIKEVQKQIDQLIFKPVDQKIVHMVKGDLNQNTSAENQLLNQYNKTAQGMMEPSARSMYETVRSMGLNYDNDVANHLAFNKGNNQAWEQNQTQQQNMKAALLKLTQNDALDSKVVQQAETALSNITGQQLLSKSDAPGSMQSMFFTLPMMLGGNPESLQVFVNSKTEGQEVDWENCNLYFLIETKKLGDVGILLNATDRNLSITVKNDMPNFKTRMQPLVATAKEKLKDIGYNVNTISFTPMTAKKEVQQVNNTPQESKPLRPIFTEKGMDFKI